MTCSKVSASRSFPHRPPGFFTEDTPTAVLVRQVLGAIAQFEKASAVAKLAAARKRKREANGKCEGRKSLPGRRKPKSGQLSLRAVPAQLAARAPAGARRELGHIIA
jgi:DNA invertase Pin-like site-specific DNA recombinase